jgi:predicted membrane-bound dolichyl-phosphate-mannose-protein mannosyltransferase
LFRIHQVSQRKAVVTAILMGLLTLLVHGYGVRVAPDAFSDEGLYLRVGTNLAQGAGLTFNNSIFLWHPPAYMLIEAAFIKVMGLANTEPLAALMSVRYLNIFFSACTASLLVLFGHKLRSGYIAGLAAAGLFLMDPYVQRINRRSMLETLAMLLVLVGMYIFFTRRPRLTRSQRLGSGIAFGLAMLTKEAMVFGLLALVAYVLWARRSQLRDVVTVVCVAFAVYLPYPAWVVAKGEGSRYLVFQVFGFERVLHSIPGYPPPAPPPGTRFPPVAPKTFTLDNLQNLLAQYAMSYVLIALAAVLTIAMILRLRRSLASRYLLTWSICSFAFALPLGKTSDQYFYYLIVPSTLVVGYVLGSLFDVASSPAATQSHSRSPSPIGAPPAPGTGSAFGAAPSLESTSELTTANAVAAFPFFARRRLAAPVRIAPPVHSVSHPEPPRSRARPLGEVGRWALLALVGAMALYNGYVWLARYALGSDDAYIQAMRYVRDHVPTGATIVSSNDVAYYFLPTYNVRLDRDRALIDGRCEGYFIMSSKDAWARYNLTTPQFYRWVLRISHPLFVRRDHSFWTVGVYARTTTSTACARSQSTPERAG